MTKSKNRGLTFLTLIASGLAPLATLAQWVDFSDDTGARLILQPFADAPLADPLADDEEKDIAVGDLDRDGDDDVLVVRKKPFSEPGPRQDVLLMNEDGVLTDRTADLAPGFITNLTDARDVFIADLDGDQWPDVVIANTFGQQPVLYRNAGRTGGVWQGLVDESGRLPPIVVPGDVDVLQFCAVWAGDVTGDNAPDLYFSNYRTTGGTNDILMINDGSGNFTNETVTRLGAYANVAFGTGAEIHDVDNDGDNDIIKVSSLYPAPPFPLGQFILFNDGNGMFETVPFQALPVTQPYMFTAGDLDGNGLIDMYLEDDLQDVVITAQSAVPDTEVFYNVATLDSARTSSFGGNTKMADMDGDGDLDVAVGPIDVDIQNCGFAEPFALLRNDGDGTLDDPWAPGEDQNFHIDPHDFGLFDLDGDGCADMFMGLCTGWRVFRRVCTPPFIDLPLVKLSLQIGMPVAGGLASLQDSDDNYGLIDAVLDTAQTQFRSRVIIQAGGAQGGAALELKLEAALDAGVARAAVRLRNFLTMGWDTLGSVQLSPLDTVFDLATPDATPYIRPDGRVVVMLQTTAPVALQGDGFRLRVDHVGVRLLP